MNNQITNAIIPHKKMDITNPLKQPCAALISKMGVPVRRIAGTPYQ